MTQLSRRYVAIDPARPGASQVSWDQWSMWCDQQWEHYSNMAYADTGAWADLIFKANLYRQTRSLINPTRRVANFYAYSVYPGWLAVNPEALPNGTASAMPIVVRISNDGDQDMDAAAQDAAQQTAEARALRRVIGQTCQWSNWGSTKSVYVRYGAVTGGVLLETEDDPERRQVRMRVVWPGLVRDLVLDTAGNVKAYALEYDVTDESGTYKFRKEIKGQTLRYFRDDRPWDRDGAGSVQTLPYPFVPAAWVRHSNMGGVFGASALYGTNRKIHEINSVMSHIADHIHKSIAAPILISGGQGIRLSGATSAATAGKTVGSPDVRTPEQIRDRVPVLIGNKDATVHTLLGDLKLADAQAYVAMLITDLQDDLAVVTSWDRLREMSAVTGPAAMRLMGDVVGAVNEAQAEYDTQLVKALQMTIAIGGFRVNGGYWGPTAGLTRQQRAFLPYGFDSWAAGMLDFDIGPRPLIPLTPDEKINLKRQELSLASDEAGAAAENAFTGAIDNPTPGGE